MDNGEFVEGSFLRDGKPNKLAYHEEQPFSDCYIVPKTDRDNIQCFLIQGILLDIHAHHVIPSTVGQYTGLKDKNGKRIFEGDIVRIFKTLFAVEWHGAEFVFGHIAGQPWSYPYFASHAESCEIIGNIHDNPELMGGAEDG